MLVIFNETNDKIDIMMVINYYNIEIVILLILAAIGVFTVSIQSMLNKSEVIPDWKAEQNKQDDELTRKLINQAWIEMSHKVVYQRDVYDTSFPERARLTDVLIQRLHNRPVSQMFYELKNKDYMFKLYPIKGTNPHGFSTMPIKAVDYLTLSNIKWF